MIPDYIGPEIQLAIRNPVRRENPIHQEKAGENEIQSVNIANNVASSPLIRYTPTVLALLYPSVPVFL